MNKLKSVFVEILGLDSDTDWSTVRYQETVGWDSVAHMAIVSEIEECFEIMLDVDDVLDMSSYDKAVEIVTKYGVSD